MKKFLLNKTAIITGAATGIGKAIAQEFENKGATVIVADLKTGFDLSNYLDSDKLLKESLDRYKKIDILVNNVGIGTSKKIFSVNSTEFEKVFATNVFGPFYLTKKITTVMKKQKKGNIIFLTSIHRNIPLGDIAYSSSKAAISLMVKEFALELAKDNIRVNGIAPGAIRSGIEKKLTRVPLGGLRGESKDIAKLATFLVSEDAKYITGEIITIDGGLSLNFPFK